MSRLFSSRLALLLSILAPSIALAQEKKPTQPTKVELTEESESAQDASTDSETAPSKEESEVEEAEASDEASAKTSSAEDDESDADPFDETPDPSAAAASEPKKEGDQEFEVDLRDQKELAAKKKKEDADKKRKKKLLDQAEEVNEVEIDPNTAPFTYHMKHLDFQVGAGAGYFPHSGLDPYRSSPGLGEMFVRAGGVPFTSGRFAFAVLGEFGGARVTNDVRDESSKLAFEHWSVGVETRYHFHHRFYSYARLAGGLEATHASLGPEGPNQLRDTRLGFRGDAALGAAVRVAGDSNGANRSPRFWIFAEGAFRYGTPHSHKLLPDEEDGPARPIEVEMPDLQLTGVQGAAGIGITL